MARFRPGWLASAAALAAVVLLAGLGTWQVQRLQWKRALLAEQNARIGEPPLALPDALARGEARAWRRVYAAGRYDAPRSILVHPVTRERRDGARVLTPLLLEEPSRPAGGAAAVLVDRGWIPFAEIEGFLDHDRPTTPARVEGILYELDLADAAPAAGEAPRVHWVRFDPARHAAQLQAQLPYALLPVLIQRGEDGSEALPLGGFERPRSRVDHRSYATTWYGMAAVAVAVWVAFGVHRARG